MKTPDSLSRGFGHAFEECIKQFALTQNLIPEPGAIHSSRFLSRALLPHIVKLSSLFNRAQKTQDEGLQPYWKESSNPTHLRLAYFLYFMPANLYRVASVWAELHRLGLRWNTKNFRALELGAGPASGACGIAAGEYYAPLGLPASGSWALIEQDRTILELGAQWAEAYFSHLERKDWSIRKFHRKLDPERGFLPSTAPRFDLWLMSYYLNEYNLSPALLAESLTASWVKHLEEEGLAIIVEPALKLQSRRLLELRKELLLEWKRKNLDFQILLPCLGHQTCGALTDPEDWCHEEVSWWRPPYFKKIDEMAGLDRKTLPFSYLVIIRSKRPRTDILPALATSPQHEIHHHRLVSPAHCEGKDREFFLCGSEGKCRARYRTEEPLQRGDILQGAEIRGDVHASRVTKIKKVL